MSLEAFRRVAHLRPGTAVTRETVSRALGDVLKVYQRQRRLEAEIKLTSQTYAAHKVNYTFSATRGPVVRVVFEGVHPDPDRVKRLIPIFEEGTVDDDLLNEGNRRVRDYYQSLGYFDARVDHKVEPPRPDESADRLQRESGAAAQGGKRRDRGESLLRFGHSQGIIERSRCFRAGSSRPLQPADGNGGCSVAGDGLPEQRFCRV